MFSVSSISFRLALGAIALMGALWLLHPGFSEACRATTPHLCLQGFWAATPTPAKPAASKAPSWDEAVKSFEAAQAKGDAKGALAWLDFLGQMAVRQYEAEEAGGVNRRVRYKLIDLDLMARRLAAGADGAAPDIAAQARDIGQVFASLATVEGIDLVLRRAQLRAPKSLSGAFQSPALKAAITEFWQDLAPTQVFFATNRTRTDEETGVFATGLSETNAVQFGAGTVAVPIYVNEVAGADQLREVEDAPEQGTRQTAGVRTVKHLEAEQFSAMARGGLETARFKEALIYVHGADTSFENALIRAGELKRALRIDGPVMLLSWAANTNVGCSSAETAKLVLLGWRRMADAVKGARLNVISHELGACAVMAPYENGGETAEKDLVAEQLILFDAAYQGKSYVHTSFYRQMVSVGGPTTYDSRVHDQGMAWVESCPWDANAEVRARAPKIGVDALAGIEVAPRPVLEFAMRGSDYSLGSILADLRAQLWLKIPLQYVYRCGMCRLAERDFVAGKQADGSEEVPIARLHLDRCGEPYELALDLRRAHGQDAEAKIDTVLESLTQDERDLVRARLKDIPPMQ